MRLDAIAADLDAKIAAEQASITEGIADARRNHMSMHDGYWKRLWALRQKRLAVQHVADAIAGAVAEA